MKKTKKDKLNVIDGKFREDNDQKNILQLPPGKSREFEDIWNKLLAIMNTRHLIPGDQFALELLCDSIVSFQEIKTILQEKGETYQTTNEDGAILSIVRPEVEISKIYFGAVIDGLRMFLLTPDSRMADVYTERPCK